SIATSREPSGKGYDVEVEKVILETSCDFVEGCDRCTVVPRWVLVITG
ncbi:hypothetical protein A2U01_0087517, partial [Trifolium medium]|nr:hypothetical protein [Trifolium medium]